MVNVKTNPSNITALVQLAPNLGVSTTGSPQIDSAVQQTANAVGWNYDEPSGVLTVYFNAVPADDGAQLLTNIQTVYSTAAFVTS